MNRPDASFADRQLPVLITTASGGGERRSTSTASYPRGVGLYAAQLIGQMGQKRGLRGGAEVLQAARAAYLGAEYSGDYDRRPTTGLIKRGEL
jgi:hypothetical protein